MKEKTKQCTVCAQTLPLSNFRSEKRNKTDGKVGRCRNCEHTIRQQNKHKKQEYDKAYYKANRDKIIANQTTYYLNNQEKVKERVKDWQASNQSTVTGYKKNNKHNRRVIINSSKLSSADFSAWETSELKICAYCGASCANSYHIDHIEPLSKGGQHELDNLVIACPTCNMQKSAHSLLIFMKKRLEVKDKKP